MTNRQYKTTAIILAAGQSKRMGSANKLLVQWHGKTLLEHVCLAAMGSLCERIIVVTGHQQDLVVDALTNNHSGREVIFAHNPEYASGMASSVKTGVQMAVAKASDAIVVLLGDMPEITSQMIDKIIKTRNSSEEGAIIVATCESKRGNPVLWPNRYFSELLKLEGDTGARQIIARYEDNIVEVELGHAARFDLDTPKAFNLTSKSTASP